MPQSRRHKVFISFHEQDIEYKKRFVRKAKNVAVGRSVDTGDIEDDGIKADTIRRIDLPPEFWIGWGRRRQWPDCSGWSAPSPPPNRTCDFHRIRLSPGWVRPAGREHRLFRHRSRVHTSLLRRSSLRSTPIRLPTFAMWTAFPSSDYYAGSVTRPALAEGWPAPTPESRTSFPSSQRLRLHIVLGPASTPCLALCRARHRRMPVRGSTASLP